MNKQTRENSTIRNDILETLDQIYPDKMIEMWKGMEVSYLEEIYEDLQNDLGEIETAAIEYERDWTGDDLECECECEGCKECSEADEDEDENTEENTDESTDENTDENTEEEASIVGEEKEADLVEPSEEDNLASSYHLFFLALQGDQYEYECQAEDLDEKGNTVFVNGVGVVGCCVAVSLLAPFALVTPASMEIYDDDSCTFPDIDLHYINSNKETNHLEDYIDANFTGLLEKEDIQGLNDLMNRVATVLDAHGVSLLPPDEGDKPVSWLKPAEDVFIEVPEDENITLKEALFYRGIF